MSTPTMSEKRKELDELRSLSANPGWKYVLLPLIERRRKAHNEAGMAKNSTPERRAEHVEAWHLANDLVEHVPNRIAALSKEIAENETKNGASTPLAPALSDRP